MVQGRSQYTFLVQLHAWPQGGIILHAPMGFRECIAKTSNGVPMMAHSDCGRVLQGM